MYIGVYMYTYVCVVQYVFQGLLCGSPTEVAKPSTQHSCLLQ